MILRITIIGLLAGVIGTGLGGIISALFKRNVDRYLDFFMGLSGGIMLAVVVFDLMKESMNEIGVLPTVIFTFVGVLLTMFLKTKLDNKEFIEKLYQLIRSGDNIDIIYNTNKLQILENDISKTKRMTDMVSKMFQNSANK